MGTRTPQCPLSPSLWGHPVLEYEDTCPHVHIQARTNTHEHTQAAASSCPAHHGLLRESCCHRSQPGPLKQHLRAAQWPCAGPGGARPWCKRAQMLRLSWERSFKKKPR